MRPRTIRIKRDALEDGKVHLSKEDFLFLKEQYGVTAARTYDMQATNTGYAFITRCIYGR